MNDEIVKEYCTIIKNKIANFNFDSAIQNADKLIINFPNCEYGYYYKAVCKYALEEIDEAIQNYKETIRLNPNFARAHFNLGLCYHSNKDYDNALINIGQALVIFSNNKELDFKTRCITAIKQIDQERKNNG